MLHDAFICHASEDKDDFVRPLAEALRDHHIEVWYDEFSLSVGDSLRETIDRGLASSRFAIVILSPNFFHKSWPTRELNGLVAREMAEDRHLILPIWHNVERDDVINFSPPLADLRATTSAHGLGKVIEDLVKKLRPAESPLIVARDFLIGKGLSPPVITDESWLDLIEIKESQFRYPDLNHDWRWIFPLPFPRERDARERGLNIAWTDLQFDWADDGKEKKICQLTHPEEVHAFLEEWPGLKECARNNPATLALYAPQLTIRGFDNGFADVFDDLMSPDNTDACRAFRYGRADTTDDNKPLCGDVIAWRHPSYGNYTPGELSYEFVNAHDASYSRRLFNGFECLIWLLSDGANWMPEQLREVLTQGFRDRVSWWTSDLLQHDHHDAFSDALFHSKGKISYNKKLNQALLLECQYAVASLEIDCDPEKISARFVERRFFEGYHEEQARFRRARKESDLQG